jgi:hypothetical protein
MKTYQQQLNSTSYDRVSSCLDDTYRYHIMDSYFEFVRLTTSVERDAEYFYKVALDFGDAFTSGGEL